MTPTVTEIFAGCGGLALGFEQAGFDTKLLVEYDKDCCDTLKINRPKWNIIHDDIKNISFKKIKTDVLTGGIPCQSFSVAGKRLGFNDTRGTLFFEYARAIKEINPKIFILENVAGLENHDNRKTLTTILNITEDLGYNVQYKILNALNYNIAQKRKRIFIVGTKPNLTFKYPTPNKKIKTIRDVLKNTKNPEYTPYSEKRKHILNMVPPGGSWVDLPDAIAKEFMGKSYNSTGGRRGMARRLSWDEPCLTLTTSPSQKFTERCHPDETRPLTIGEYAKIQNFPNSWKFCGSLSSKYKQIGNAVPVNLAKKIGQQTIKSLQKENDTKR